MTSFGTVKIAAIQATPVILDAEMSADSSYSTSRPAPEICPLSSASANASSSISAPRAQLINRAPAFMARKRSPSRMPIDSRRAASSATSASPTSAAPSPPSAGRGT